MATYKTVKGFIKGMRHLADKQEMSMMKGWDDISEEAQGMIYGLIADVQNGISELEGVLKDSQNKEKI